jgi:hypothetical protein
LLSHGYANNEGEGGAMVHACIIFSEIFPLSPEKSLLPMASSVCAAVSCSELLDRNCGDKEGFNTFSARHALP